MMQTFLPYPDYKRSASVLDRLRLGKQRIEAFQILETLGGKRANWRHHPAVQMWRGSEFALVEYGQAMCDEWIARGYEDNTRPLFEETFVAGLSANIWLPSVNDNEPWWLGYEPFHRAHRSALLRKLPEHYRPFWPDEVDNLDYVWPPGRPGQEG